MLPVVHLAILGRHVTLATHALAVLVATIVGTLVAVRRARDPEVVLAGAPAVALAALGGAHALFRTLHGAGAFAWTGGLSSMGGVVAVPLAIAALARTTRTPMARLLDAYAPGALVGLAIGRIGCFLGGCCAGRPTTLPWGVVVAELGPLPRHPLPLYAAVVDVALARWACRAGGAPGAVARRVAVGFGLARAALELLRDPAAADAVGAGPLTLAQLGALALAAAAMVAGRDRRDVARLAPA